MGKKTQTLLFRFAIVSATALNLIGCSNNKATQISNDNYVIGFGEERLAGSVPEGNLITSAIKEMNDVDVVLYPSLLLPNNSPTLLRARADAGERETVIDLFPSGAKDQFLIGSMSGKDLRRFVENRSQENYNADLQVAGIKYDIHYLGGWKETSYVTLSDGSPIKDDERYRVALSKFYYFSGATFPSYKYRNGLGLQNFVESRFVSAKESLKKYFDSGLSWPFLKEVRARVTRHILAPLGFRRISEIQGPSHRSPMYGHPITTRGIVTAVGSVQWYPGGEEIYIQTEQDDGDPATSEGILVSLGPTQDKFELGDEVEVDGVVYEQVLEGGLGRTSIREVSRTQVLRKGVKLPEPVRLGMNGRPIPNQVISSYRGNLNLKPRLNLNDGVDFYESLEGMRVVIENPRVVGFRGGNEDLDSSKPKGYLNLYVVPNGDLDQEQRTPKGGIIIDQLRNDFNPNIMQILSNHFTQGIATDAYFNIGDQMQGDVVGVLGFEPNIFGGGDYSIVLPEIQKSVTALSSKAKKVELEDRPRTSLISTEKQLTVATYNVENLSANQVERVKLIAKSIAYNLKCPDIVNFAEIQDNNGDDFLNGSSGAQTLKKIIQEAQKSGCANIDYQFLNIDPVNNSEGGKPGGNIRVAMIYNQKRVQFSARGEAGTLTDNRVLEDGSLEFNPGRVFPNSPLFSFTRKSLAAEFYFRGERLTLIGNHFNAKLGDTSLWAAEQPAYLGSENKRQALAQQINLFVQYLLKRKVDANILVLGDFNALIEENSMKVLAGQQLKNLITWNSLVPVNDRYTISYNGNSEAIDFIFASQNMLRKSPEMEIVHINTDFMGRLSDHDPVISRFTFD